MAYEKFCASCLVDVSEYKQLEEFFLGHCLSRSEILFLGHDLLTKAMESKVDWFKNFCLKGDAKVNNESKSKSETPLYWNGTPLCHAVGTDSIEIMQTLLQENYVCDKRTPHDYYGMLRMAAELDETEIVKVLLSDWKCNPFKDKTSPHYDIVMNNLETVRSLLQTSVDVNERFCPNSIAFKMAIQLAMKQISDIFLNPLSFNKPPLYVAAETNNISMMKMLLLEDADINVKSYNNLTPFHIAARLGNTESAKILLDHGASVYNCCTLALGKLLIAAVKDDNEALVELLLKRRNHLTNDGETLLHLEAACRSSLKVVKLLLDNIFRIDARHGNNEKRFYYTLCETTLRIIDMIIEVCSNPNSLMGKTQSKISQDLLQYGFGLIGDNEHLLDKAIQSGCLNIVEYLLNLGINVNNKCTTDRCELNWTRLHMAIACRKMKIAKLLIKNNADVNAKDATGATPLHYACRTENSIFIPDCVLEETNEIIGILLNEGATVNTKEIDGKTALHCAVKNGWYEAVELLIKNGADVADRTNDGATSLHIAAAHDQSDIIAILLDTFDDIDCTDGDGKTALHTAVEYNNIETVRLLLDRNSDINLLPNTCCEFVNTHNYPSPTRSDSDFDDSDDSNDSFDLNRCRIRIRKPRRNYDHIRERRDSAVAGINEIVAILKDHIVKMTALNRWVSNEKLQALSLSGIRLQDQCNAEIECMRQKRIGVSHVSYYDVLTKGGNQLALYMRNKDIVDSLKTGDHKHMFSLYSSMLDHCFENGQKRAGLLDSSLKSFKFLTRYALPDLLTIELFDYLSNEDLRNLIKAAPCDESDN